MRIKLYRMNGRYVGVYEVEGTPADRPVLRIVEHDGVFYTDVPPDLKHRITAEEEPRADMVFFEGAHHAIATNEANLSPEP